MFNQTLKPHISTTESGWSFNKINLMTFSIITFALLLSGGSFSRFRILQWLLSRLTFLLSTWLQQVFILLSVMLLQMFYQVHGVETSSAAATPWDTRVAQLVFSCFTFLFLACKVIPYSWHDKSTRLIHCHCHSFLFTACHATLSWAFGLRYRIGRARAGPWHRQYRQMLRAPFIQGAPQMGEEKKKKKKM